MQETCSQFGKLNQCNPLFIHCYFKKSCKKSKHPISQDRKVVWVVSRYMVQALLASFQNSHITLQSWLIGFLIFFWQRFLKWLYTLHVHVSTLDHSRFTYRKKKIISIWLNFFLKSKKAVPSPSKLYVYMILVLVVFLVVLEESLCRKGDINCESAW